MVLLWFSPLTAFTIYFAPEVLGVKSTRRKMNDKDDNTLQCWATGDTMSVGDNIVSLTESTSVSVESLEDGTFYEDDNEEFVATLSEMSEKDTRLNYSDDELLDEYCRESELR